MVDLVQQLREGVEKHYSRESLETMLLWAADEIERLRQSGKPELVKGTVDQSTLGPAEFSGIDVFHGETTYEFIVDRRRKFVLPNQLDAFLNR